MMERLKTALSDRYNIERELGAGGMATVYLAHDEKHHRKVAVKVLHPDLAAALGGERFLAEIRTTANLQHPHILPLHDSGVADGFLFYVMPYVEGESLRGRLNREKQLPIGDAVRLAKEVAGALDYAHRQGVVHRDIKPENILLHDGAALVADFGIALAVQTAGGQRMTQTGLSLGTPQYMSPEQALGERNIDARADQYALAAVTYEMLVGEPPFTGPTVQAILARVMTEQPRSLSLQRKSIPAAVEVAVMKALDKLPADRFASTAEFSTALSAPPGSVATLHAHPIASPTGARNAARAILPWAIAVFAILAAFIASQRGPSESGNAGAIVATLIPEPGDVWREGGQSYAISPDGSTVVLSMADGANRDYAAGASSVLALRSLDSLGTRKLAGTAGATYPFWSPRGDAIAFFADGSLKTIQLSSGAVRALCPAVLGRGGDWSKDDVILYSPERGASLYRTTPAGGSCEKLAVKSPPDAVSVKPYFFPDGRHFVATTDLRAWLGELDGDSLTWLIDLARARAVLAPPDYLLYREAVATASTGARQFFADRVDLKTRRLVGDPVRVVYGITNPGGNTSLSASSNGVLIGNMRVADRNTSRVVASSTPTGLLGDTMSVPENTFGPHSLSHDGSRVAFGGWNISVLEVERGVSTVIARSTRTPVSPNGYPQWSPRDTAIAFIDRDDAAATSWIQLIDVRNGNQRPLTETTTGSRRQTVLTDWSSDGRTFVLALGPAASVTQWEPWVYAIGDSAPRKLFTENADVEEIRLAPNHRWIAYQATADGRTEINIRSMPGPGPAIRVSTGGGRIPRWSANSSELFYLSSTDAIMSVRIGADDKLSTPRQVAPPGRYGGPAYFDVKSDGTGFFASYSTAAPPSLTLIVNWWNLLGKAK
jgi:eukaryotic-like serine/threonine-protein kinase